MTERALTWFRPSLIFAGGAAKSPAWKALPGAVFLPLEKGSDHI